MSSNFRPLHLVLSALGIERTPATQYSARCPVHDDNKASLSIAEAPDGTVGIHCHAGCSADAVCAALGLGMADLFPRRLAPKRGAGRRDTKLADEKVESLSSVELAEAWDAAKMLGPASLTGYKLKAVYPYRDVYGEVWGWRARYESQSGAKQIKPFHHDGRRWTLKERAAFPKGKPLYRLPEVLAASGPVYIVEGEKCADELAALGVPVTTSGAAMSASKADWSDLAGRACILWPDNDKPGAQYAAEVGKILEGLGCTVELVDNDALGLSGDGDDAADWVAANPSATATDVHRLPTTQLQGASNVQLVRASEIEPKAISWLWPGYVARKMLTLIAGNGGTGKTTLALSIAAAVTRASPLPDGVAAPIGSVVMWSGEDALAEVLVPRLKEANAALDRVHFVTGGRDGGVFDPANDMAALNQAARRVPDLALIIIDPIVSAVAGDSHKNAEVRRGLQPLLDLSAETGAAVIGITHYAKNTAGRSTTERVIGSVAFSAVARTVLATAMSTEGEGRLVRSKSNIGLTGDGFAYSIEVVNRLVGDVPTQVTKIVWGRPLYGFADELLGQIESKRLPKDEAAEWLSAALQSGPVASKELRERAEADGIAWRTVERAKEALGVAAQRHTEPGRNKGKGEWSWRLPPAKHRQ